MGLPITGPSLQTKALDFYNAMNDGNKKFKHGYGICQLFIQGESLSADFPAAQRYKETFEQIIQQKELKAEQVKSVQQKRNRLFQEF